MSDGKLEQRNTGIELEYQLDAPLQKVWRAISIPAFRQHWLPAEELGEADAASITPYEEISYRMRDDAMPHLESTVTFRLAPNASGGTSLRIIHELKPERLATTVANDNCLCVMRAA